MSLQIFDSISAIFGNTSPSPQQTRGYGQQGDNHYRGRAPERSHQDEEERGPSVDNMERDETSEREDLLDQHVAYFMKHHPEVHTKHNLVRVRPGVYNFDGREITVEWFYSEDPEQPGYLIAVDGPLRQPFADYMQDNENGIYYDDKRLGRSSLSLIPKGKRLSFGDGNKVYSRLEAMKVAKEQALVRERAADYVKDGMQVPQYELMSKYKKTISQKLGERRQRPTGPMMVPEPEVQAPQQQQAPAEAPLPVQPPPAAAAAAPPKSRASGKQTHGAPKYCANHNETTKRKKTKPKNLPCSSCQTVIQTNYVEFTICPTCSENDHRCMCCGCPAVGTSAPAPAQAPSSPMNARASRSPQPGKSPQSPQLAPMSPMNLFGMPDLFGGSAKAAPSPGMQRPSSGMLPQPQNNAFASSNAYASTNAYAQPQPMASQNPYASQNAFASYNPMASQNAYVGRR